jgi:hypothetical protein
MAYDPLSGIWHFIVHPAKQARRNEFEVLLAELGWTMPEAANQHSAWAHVLKIPLLRGSQNLRPTRC